MKTPKFEVGELVISLVKLDVVLDEHNSFKGRKWVTAMVSEVIPREKNGKIHYYYRIHIGLNGDAYTRHEHFIRKYD